MRTIILSLLAIISLFAQSRVIVNPFPPGSSLEYIPTPSSGPGSGTVSAAGCGLVLTPTSATVAQSVATAAHNGSYAILTGDCGKSLTTNTAAAWTIAQSGTAGFEAGKYWILNNVGVGSLTVTATTSTFYGGPSANISGSVLTVPTLTSATIISDGANYQVLSGGGGVAPNGSSTDILTSNGVGGFGTSLPVPLAANKGGTGLSGSLTGARKANGAGVDTQAACADLSNAGSGCSSGGIPSGTGAVYSNSGVGTLVSGTASNCVLVNGTSAPCDAPGQAAVANVTPVTATNPSSVTALQQLTLTAGLLNIAGNSGGTYNYQAAGNYTVASLQTPTLTWALHGCTNSACSGGVDRTLFTIVTPAVVTATNNVWIIRAKMANTATGSSGTLFAHGTVTIELTAASDLGTPSNDSNTTSTAALDLTGVVYLQLYVTASSSNAGNSVVNDQSSLEPASAIGPTGATGSAGPSSTVFITATGGATNTLIASPSPAISSYTNLLASMTVDACTPGDTTLNISSVGAKHIYFNGVVLTGTAPLEICNGATWLLAYNPADNSSAGGFDIVSQTPFGPACSSHTLTVVGSGSNATYAWDGGSTTALPTASASVNINTPFSVSASMYNIGSSIYPSTGLTGITNQNTVNGVTLGLGLQTPVTNSIAYSTKAFDVGGTGSSTNFWPIGTFYTPTLASHTPTITLTSSCSSGNCYLSGLTAGTVKISMCEVLVP